jgi:SAM-dependent methyltransferase
MENEYTKIVNHYEQCFLTHGDNHKGVDWPNQADLDKRFQVAFELTQKHPTKRMSILDFGCGNGLFVDYLDRHQLLEHVDYTGLDLSPIFIECCQKKYPGLPFICTDVLQTPLAIGKHDYIIMNGVLTEKCSLEFADMWQYAQTLLTALFNQCRIGIAFNVMSAHVDWKRDDLFHLPFDQLAAFLKTNLSRNFTFRNDYGLFEFTTYVYR